jgi:hypothetical protein
MGWVIVERRDTCGLGLSAIAGVAFKSALECAGLRDGKLRSGCLVLEFGEPRTRPACHREATSGGALGLNACIETVQSVTTTDARLCQSTIVKAVRQ